MVAIWNQYDRKNRVMYILSIYLYIISWIIYERGRCTMEDLVPSLVKSIDEVKLRMCRRRNNTAIFTDAWYPGIGEQKVPERGLLMGELSAVTFRVGCYIVRSAQRVYKIHGSGCRSEVEVPADEEEIEIVRKDMECRNDATIDLEITSWNDKFCLTHEISAKHISVSDNTFTYICHAICARNSCWYEYIGDIYAVKEYGQVSDRDASLLVYMCYVGSPSNVDAWYKMEPSGKVTVFKEGIHCIMTGNVELL